nr:MAG TPA: hypothetical protein [Caudoviricetes sp.]DAS79746.1 MAG TPA: hypothetical protein [Caudoviricetes sp.]DAX99234.1 MAG TPA: hypothetical protein [Caudoviricetes sp.]
MSCPPTSSGSTRWKIGGSSPQCAPHHSPPR